MFYRAYTKQANILSILSFITQEMRTKIVFVGDLMFAGGGQGRTDFSYCCYTDLQSSIVKIINLPNQTQIYCGHWKATSVIEESQYFI